MKSYASIDRIEGNFAVCEVEMLELENSKNVSNFDKETKMMDIPMEKFPNDMGEVKEGDILVVEHNDEEVTEVYDKDEKEKQRRIKAIQEMLGE